MRVGRELRRAIIARIESQVSALGGRVYDQAPDDAGHPYCALGNSDWSPLDSDCIDGRTWYLQVDIWHSGSNKGAVEDLVDDICAALQDFEAPALAMHPANVVLARVLDDPSGDLHGAVQIEAMIDG